MKAHLTKKIILTPDQQVTIKTEQMSGGSVTKPVFSGVPGKVTVDVSQYLHEVRMDRGEANAGSLPHVDGALLRQVHVVEVDELKLGLLLWPEWTQS